MTNKSKAGLLLVALLVLAWWFRYDLECGGNGSCIAYDRLTGNWIRPAVEARKSYKESSTNNEYQAAPAASTN